MQAHYRSGWDNTLSSTNEDRWRDDTDLLSEITGSDKIAVAWIKKFGNVASICAQKNELLLIEARYVDAPEQANTACNKIRIFNEYMCRSLYQNVNDLDVIKNMTKFIRYLKMTMHNSSISTIKLVHLNENKQILLDEVFAKGCENYVHFYVREILKRALEVRSSIIILATNHPNNDNEPTNYEISQTLKLLNACILFDIVVQDHIIITKNGGFSFKSNGLLDIHQNKSSLKSVYPTNKRVRRAA